MAPFEPLEENLRATLGAFARATAWGDSRDCGGIAVAASAVNFAMFNAAILTAPVEAAAELEARVARAARYFAARGLPWSLWLCQGWLAAGLRAVVAELLARQGLHVVVELPGMIAERVLPAARPLPELPCRPVLDARARVDFNHIMTATFGIPLAIAREIYESEGTWRTGFRGWVGYLNGIPVATAATVISGGVVGVYAVGTLPAYQRQGYGEVVMRRALEDAREHSGLERTVLQSSEAGFRLYRRMGYRSITRYAVFAFG